MSIKCRSTNKINCTRVSFPAASNLISSLHQIYLIRDSRKNPTEKIQGTDSQQYWFIDSSTSFCNGQLTEYLLESMTEQTADPCNMILDPLVLTTGLKKCGQTNLGSVGVSVRRLVGGPIEIDTIE